MKRSLIVIIAIALVLSFSLVSRSLASNSHQGDHLTSGIVVGNGDCKGDKRDDC